VLEGHGGQQVDQAGQRFVDAPARIALVEDVLEPGVFLLDGFEGVVEQAADTLNLYSKVLPFLTSSLVPMATLALALRKSQRASAGTQKTFFSV
jgi:hypothetical protein